MAQELSRWESRITKIREAKAALASGQTGAGRAKGRRPGEEPVAGQQRPAGGHSKCKRDFGEPDPAAQRNFSAAESKIIKDHQDGPGAGAVLQRASGAGGRRAIDRGGGGGRQRGRQRISDRNARPGQEEYGSETAAGMGRRRLEGREEYGGTGAAKDSRLPGAGARERQGWRGANEGGRGGHGRDAQAAPGQARRPAIAAKKGAAGSGVRMAEEGVGLRRIFAAGIGESARRVEPRDGGGKPAAHGENESSAARGIQGKPARLRAKAIQSK